MRPPRSRGRDGPDPESNLSSPGYPIAIDTDDDTNDGILADETGSAEERRRNRLVNDAIDEIGLTGYHARLFCLSGFGYAVDSLVILLQSVIASQAAAEFGPGFRTGLTMAAYVGMLVGALVWGLSADLIGRRLAFNVSLLISGIFTIAAGASPSWVGLGALVALACFGSGGNLVLDTAVFLEYLPAASSWLVTLMAAWWGVGQLVAGLLAWAFLPNYSCPLTQDGSFADGCGPDGNKGWRYVWYSAGAIVFTLSLLRLTVIRLRETPKFLLAAGRDAEVIDVLSGLARKYDRPFSLTLEMLQSPEPIKLAGSLDRPVQPVSTPRSRSQLSIWGHIRSLFATRRMGLSIMLVWLSWTVIGLAYPLYNIFLPAYLASRGGANGKTSASVTWRNYSLANLCGILGPIPAAFMIRSRYFWGRRGTMAIGALITCVFLFAYTQARTQSQNVGFTCAISFSLNIYYSTLYAYTPEILPAADRGTGNGIAIGLNRVMGILSAVIGQVADTSTAVPIFICAALYVVLAVIALLFPFEPLGRRGS